jgi:Flp pilus assembly protein TadD
MPDREVAVKQAWLLVATLSLSPLVAGCAGSGSGRGSGSNYFRFWDRNEQGLTTSPDVSKAYGVQNEVSPKRGEVLERTTEMPKTEQPGPVARLTAAVTGSSAVKTVTSAFNKQDVPTRGIAASETTAPDPKPAGADFYIELAQLQERNGNLANAAGQYQTALKLAPNSLEGLLGLARLEDRQGNLEVAARLYRQAAKAHPGEPVVCNDLALCLSRQQRTHEAITAMSQAISLRPDRKLYRNNMAKLLVDIGQGEKALEHLSAVHPPAVAHYNLGYLLHQRGDNAAAARHFALALAADPSMVEARQWLDALAQPAPTPAPTASGPNLSPPTNPAATGREAHRQPLPAGVLPMVLRPESDPAREPRYGMDPAGHSPPRRY